MKALSIRQPWASLIIFGGKDIENRTWRTKHRGPILIHASLKIERDVPHDFDDLPTGGIIGQADLVNVVEKSDSEWWQGPIGFVLANPKPLPFYALKGKLGLFEVEK